MSGYPFVAAIDFGTTNSGYAFSTKHDYETSPLKISAASWVAGSARLQSQKTPTCVLFDENKKFHSFGYEAEDKYSDLALDEEHEEWYYFRRFKMELYSRSDFSSSFELKTQDGKSMKAMDVFSACIEFLKDHLLKTAEKQGVTFDKGDIRWILTVPAIWTEPGKQFMRKAAEQAGISPTHLKLVLEPEAAAIYCTNLPIDKICADGENMTVFQKGTKYMVLDAGGGTIDITVQEVQSGGVLKELYKANGGDWGGTSVDQQFEELLQDIVGKDLFQDFKQNEILDALNLYRNFEMKKRTIQQETDGSVTITVPPVLQKLSKTGKKGGDPNTGSNKKHGNVSWVRDKLQIPDKLARDLFSKSIDAIISHVKNIFSKPEVKGTSIILMVGGYSECELLQHAIKTAFSDKKIIVPYEAGLSILKGAVINGHVPNIITTRVCRFTYGVACNRTFREGKDKEEYRVKGAKGDSRCVNGFKVYACTETSVELGTAVNKYAFHVSSPHETGIDLPVYASEEPDPDYVTNEKCQKLGMLRIEMPDISKGIHRSVEVEMIFGGTELEVRAVDSSTKKITQASFNFVG
ncbi:heat shock 70 kDa protein 12A-like [Mizuhopecten yessoensis]|uniref:Heat shock 70 kDa protein n=1 Tax=Mizuhopecten yessoensis TaxID=6573 RepID=A0A1C9U2Y2_MIZYE|nr:heat shock 70 kDa protein 12A-like [Mizuhopecten yessoensis]AOR17346.1 heat shock 70 kDa protein [Mizuhopecten yessoensis]OWF52452.1 Heat shock 70 kDa protein 12B [Mizuhopecten yessoensis]